MSLGEEMLGELVLGGLFIYEKSIEQGITKLVKDAGLPIQRLCKQTGQTYPVITYEVTANVDNGKCIREPDSTPTATFEFNIMSPNYDHLFPIAKALRQALDHFHGMAWDREVLFISHEGEQDEIQRANDGSEKVIFTRVCVFDVTYRQ